MTKQDKMMKDDSSEWGYPDTDRTIEKKNEDEMKKISWPAQTQAKKKQNRHFCFVHQSIIKLKHGEVFMYSIKLIKIQVKVSQNPRLAANDRRSN